MLLIVYKRRHWPLRRAVLMSATIWGVMLAGVTEILSLLHALTFGPLCAAWLGLTVVILIAAAKWPGAARDAEAVDASGRVGAAAWLLLPGVFIIAGALVTALACPPNNYDSMTYHMARVAHWVQDASVEYYPTHILRQLHMPPLAEYAILHLQIASGGDRFANCVQWLAMAGCLMGISLIAAQLGAGRVGQLLAAGICAAIPMGALQSSTTQNDYVLSLWLVCLVSFILSAANAQQRDRWMYVLAAGGAMGLAVLTKGTAYLLAAPFVIWLVASQLRRRRLRAIPALAAAGAIVLAVNAGFYCRNLDLYHAPLGWGLAGPHADMSAGNRLDNQAWGPRVLASNLLRNVAMELAPPINNPRGLREGGPADQAITAAARGALHAIGADPDDPQTTYADFGRRQRFEVYGFLWNDENFAAAPAHIVLFAAAAAGLALLRLPQRRLLLLYAAAIIAGFLFFCLFLKWQPWHARLHLPLLVLGSALTGVVLERLAGRWVAAAIVSVLLIAATAPLLWAANRPMLGQRNIFNTPRDELYFAAAGPQQEAIYRDLLRELPLRRFNKIGLVLGGDNIEYPIWVLLRGSSPTTEIRHVEVVNISGVLAKRPPAAAFAPDIIFENVPAAGGTYTIRLRQAF
ncbi:MAG: glycosyltransferase family 39 protein [Planctomycetaceae bacterium]|nr:glycosyltransferase family 39 protein [Planctomycetaceae bacterium]